MNRKEASGLDAESGAALRKKFRRAVVAGGSLRGARYSDLPDSEIRKCSKGYRGDPRFVQYCKQFVSSELVDDSCIPAPITKVSDEKQCEASTFMKGIQIPQKFLTYVGQMVQHHFRGRWLSFGFLVCFLCIVVSRPAFGRLCGRIFSLVIRMCFRRVIGLISVIIDSVLEETAIHLEEALMPSPETIPTRESPNYVMQPQTHSFSQLLMNGLCVGLGSLLHRTFQRAAPIVLPPHP